MAKETLKDGERWVTVTKDGPMHGRHLKLDKEGTILAGNVPKEFHGKHLRELAKKVNDEAPKEPPKEKEPWEMDARQYYEHVREKNGGQAHHDSVRRIWLSHVKQKVAKDGIDSIKHLTDNSPEFKAYVENGFKTPRPPREKLAGEGMPFKKEQNERNNKFLDRANGAFFLMTQGERVKEMRKILHKQGYDAALDYIKKVGNHADDKTMNSLRELAETHKAQGEGLAPEAKPETSDAQAEPQKKPDAPTAEEKPRGVNKTEKKNPLDELHNDVQAHIAGKMDEGELLQKHKKLLDRIGKHAAEVRGKQGEGEDFGQEAHVAALKTLRALKNGTQKPKEGQHLGEHMVRRVKQGIGEALRQSNENPLSREGSKLAAIINHAKNEHLNEKGAEPSEDELFNRVKDHHVFQSTRYVAPGTKKSVDDPREKFNAVREGMKGQNSTASLDQGVKGKDGDDAGSVRDNIKDEGGTPEDKVIDMENEKEMKDKRDKLHGVLKEFGLSDSEAHAIRHRFGVGHAEPGFKDWNEVSKHMTKDLGKKVNPETAKKHFHNGRAKLHQYIGDERMGMLMQKSLLEDSGVANLVYHLHMLGVYDLLKSLDVNDDTDLETVWSRTVTVEDHSELIKSLQSDEFVASWVGWADGSITAHIHTVPRG